MEADMVTQSESCTNALTWRRWRGFQEAQRLGIDYLFAAASSIIALPIERPIKQ
ncbi:MAG: hypothetical protein ACI9F9_002504 [Candidatus Paceibacteria bacterium]|jgi:hypothetical protein